MTSPAPAVKPALESPVRMLRSLASAASSLIGRAGALRLSRTATTYDEPLDDLQPSPGPFQIHDRCLVRRFKRGAYSAWAPAEVIGICPVHPNLEARGEFLYEVHWFRDSGRAQMIGRFSLLRGEITFPPEARGDPTGSRRKRRGLRRHSGGDLGRRSTSFESSEKVLVHVSYRQGEYVWMPALVVKRHPKETRAEYSIRVTAGALRGLETRYAGPTFYYHFANVEMLREKGYKVVSEEDVDEFGVSSCPEYTRCSLNSRW
ncbi:hypothetical protein K523DRAFT_418708 [Schizophyllum commune Tattone D]|nr:hypothetical protein K523DRAFT_418708 [Schizophyllum commune Tattone D]